MGRELDTCACLFLFYCLYPVLKSSFYYHCKMCSIVFNHLFFRMICIREELYFASSKLELSMMVFSEKAMAPHSSTLAWKIPWMEEPGGLQSMGSLTVGHDWETSLSLFTFMHWRRKWQPTPVLLPGKSQGRGTLVGCHLWGHIESDTTEVT